MSDIENKINKLQKELDDLRREAQKPPTIKPMQLYKGRLVYPGGGSQPRIFLADPKNTYIHVFLENGELVSSIAYSNLPRIGEFLAPHYLHVIEEKFNV